jgi:hypothetical protein
MYKIETNTLIKRNKSKIQTMNVTVFLEVLRENKKGIELGMKFLWKLELKNLKRVRREMITNVWPCKKNG